MNFIFRFLLSIVLFNSFFNIRIIAQNEISQQILFNQICSAAEKEYGIDQELVNGVFYENNYLPSVGHPFFLADTFINGSAIYREKLYLNLLLKYDICDQHLLVNYTLNDFQTKFYLTKEFLSEFSFENKKFVKLSIPGEETDRIYQIIGDTYEIKVLYKWDKFRTKSDQYFMPLYEFSADEKISFILINNNLFGYKRNNSFVRLFPKQDQKLIKKFIQENKIIVKFSTDSEMDLLIRYCNSLNNSKVN